MWPSVMVHGTTSNYRRPHRPAVGRGPGSFILAVPTRCCSPEGGRNEAFVHFSAALFRIHSLSAMWTRAVAGTRRSCPDNVSPACLTSRYQLGAEHRGTRLIAKGIAYTAHRSSACFPVLPRCYVIAPDENLSSGPPPEFRDIDGSPPLPPPRRHSARERFCWPLAPRMQGELRRSDGIANGYMEADGWADGGKSGEEGWLCWLRRSIYCAVRRFLRVLMPPRQWKCGDPTGRWEIGAILVDKSHTYIQVLVDSLEVHILDVPRR